MDILFKYKTADIADRRMFCVLIFFFLIRCHKCNCNRRRAILIPTNMYIIVIFYGIPNAMDGSMAFWRSQIAQFSGSVRLWFLTSQINERRWRNWNDRIQMAQCGSSGMACEATTVMATDGTEECYNIIKRSFNTTDRWSTASDKRRCLNTFFFYYVFITAKSLQPIRTIHRYLNRCACLHSAQKFRLQRCLLRFKYYEIYFMWLIEWCLVWSTQVAGTRVSSSIVAGLPEPVVFVSKCKVKCAIDIELRVRITHTAGRRTFSRTKAADS